MAKKVILKDHDNIEILPITRGELVLDSSGELALHSNEFLATDSWPGLMSPADKVKITNLAESIVDSALSTTSKNPVQNKIITGAINNVEQIANDALNNAESAQDTAEEAKILSNKINQSYLKSASISGNTLTIVDQSDSEIDFYNTTYNTFLKETSEGSGGRIGLVPKPNYNSGSATRYLREDGTWVKPTNTTYSTMTTSEANTGTSTTGKLITAKILHDKITSLIPGEVTTDQPGLMSPEDKEKLDGIIEGAEVNQNAFSNIKVGSTTIKADSKTDTLTLEAGNNIILTPDTTNDKVVMSSKDTTYTFTGGTNNFTVTPLNGESQTVTITPSISKNVTYTGTLVDEQVATFEGTSGKIKASGFTIASNVPANAKFTDTTYSNGIGLSLSDNVFSLNKATTSTIGGIKIAKDNSYTVTTNTSSISSNITTVGKYYGVELDSTGKAFVYVPWSNTTYNLMTADEASSGTGTNARTISAKVLHDKINSLLPSVMTGATSSNNGTKGLVPAPSAGKQNTFLKGDGTWSTPSNTTYTFTNGTSGEFTVTPSGGSAQTVSIGKPKTAGVADKVSNKLTLKISSGTTENTDKYTYDGSSAKTLDIKQGSNVILVTDTNSLTISAKDTTYSNATTTVAGLMSASDKLKLDGIASGANKYTLPTASSSVLGGIKVGNNLNINSNGVLSALDTTYDNATQSSDGLMSSEDKTKLDGIAAGANKYTLPTASSTILGGVKIGNNISINTNGVISVPTAGANVLGVVKGFHRTSGTASGTKTTSASNNPSINDRTTTSGRYYGVETDSTGSMFVNVPWTDTNTDTDTHWVTSMYIGSANTTSKGSTANGDTYIKLFDNSTLRNQYNIKGTGRVSVTSDSVGDIAINVPTTIDWSNVDNKPTKFTPSTHEHPTSQITSLTSYTKATSASTLASTDSLNTALGKLEYKADTAYTWYKNITATDTDTIINKWDEIVNFVDSVKEGSDIVDEFVTRKTAQTITGTKTFNNGEQSPIVLARSSSDLVSIQFNGPSGILGYLGFSDTDPIYRRVSDNAYLNLLHSGNSSVSKSGQTLSVTINGVTQSLTNTDTNTWRPITDSYSGTASDTSLSQKGANTLYNALVNGYASSAGNADTVDNLHASAFAKVTSPNNLLHSNNEFTYASPGFSGGIWHNYRTSDNSNGNITEYFFGDGKGTALASISKGQFSGNAASATKLTTDAGSATNPIYFSGGKPVACSYSLNKTVPSDAKFTDTWRPVTNTYIGSDQSTCVSQYGTNALYNTLVNGYASSAGSVPWSGVTDKPVLPVYYSLSGNDAFTILKNNATSFTRSKLIHAYLSHGSASFAMGWMLSGYDSSPYGAFIVNSYGDDWTLVGASAGTWTNRVLLHSGNSSVSKSGETLTVKINGVTQSITNTIYTSLKNPYSLTINNSAGTAQVSYDGSVAKSLTLTKSMVGLSNVENTAIYTRYLGVNGENWTFASTYYTADGKSTSIYAPTTAGRSGQYLVSNGSGAPYWVTMNPYNYNTSRNANTVLAAPDGYAGSAEFRKLVAADIPSLPYVSTSGGTITGLLNIKRNYAGIRFFDTNDNPLGYFGFSSNLNPVIYDQYGNTPYTVLHSGNISSYALTSLPSHSHNYAGSSSAGGAANTVVVTSISSNSNYRIVGSSGNSLYSADNMYYNASTGKIFAKGFYVLDWGSSGYVLTSDGSVKQISTLSVNSATYANTMSSFDTASVANVDRYIWMSWSDNTGKPAYNSNLTFNTSTNTLKTVKVNASEGFFQTSDETLKNFCGDIKFNFDIVKTISKKYFTWKVGDTTTMHLGTSAQEVQKIYPELVSKDSIGKLSVAYDKLSIVALKGIDELYNLILELKTENKELKNRLEQLETK